MGASPLNRPHAVNVTAAETGCAADEPLQIGPVSGASYLPTGNFSTFCSFASSRSQNCSAWGVSYSISWLKPGIINVMLVRMMQLSVFR
jgi:hypothetical protein